MTKLQKAIEHKTIMIYNLVRLKLLRLKWLNGGYHVYRQRRRKKGNRENN